MGSIRSSPDLTKLSIMEKKKNTTYAVKEMCGNHQFIQVGGSIWKMLL